MSTHTEARQSTGRSGARARGVPQRNPQLAHLGLPALRSYRQELAEEERRVSYWRRLVQARLDVISADTAALARLQAVLTEDDPRSRHTALLAVHPVEDVPPLPDLAVLWAARPDPDDEAAIAGLLTRLADAERTLSTYRQALHRRLDVATEELIARYRENPSACLSALPLEGAPSLG